MHVTGHRLARGITKLAFSCDSSIAQFGAIGDRASLCDDRGVTDHWPEIDQLILRHQILPALVALQDETSCSLPEAIAAFDERYRDLRQSRPNDFTVNADDYGSAVYT